MKKRILMVGHTDTCLMPLCTAILTCMCQKKGLLGIEFKSCGFWAINGQGVDRQLVTVAGEMGLDLTQYRARYISAELTGWADIILPQDEMIAKGLRGFLRRDVSKVGKVMKLHQPASAELEQYRVVREEVTAFCERLMRKLMTEIRENKKTASEVELRPVTMKEAESVLRLEEACFSHPWTMEGITSELEKEAACFVGAYHEGTMVGYGSLNIVCGVAYINNIAVEDAYRHKGIGSRILERLEAYCREHNAESMTLEVRSQNTAAIGLYRKQGFEVCGCRKNFYRDPADDGWIMTKML